ncbi:neutrophil cytosol factor 2 [Protopterus annectens]|uniref:neutrophil cytosol factor 2 n=1 Tax=Protopterus annectens TaxID=7888 RepID=UPI001CFA09A3|nr:neutrophil cytosol factor 2 [Protopterus annectens]
MSLVETIALWDEAVAAADKKDWKAALKLFTAVHDPNSKICFNIGCLHLVLGDLDEAERAFDSSIAKDEHLAVAFFQRAITFYRKEMYEDALRDYKEAFNQLRGNSLIDYKLLGFRFRLCACEVLYNTALVHAQLNQWQMAEEFLTKAASYKTEYSRGNTERALDAIMKKKLFDPLVVPVGELFRPNKQQVAQLQKRDFLGKDKVKVVASVVDKDTFSGFAGVQPQAEEAPVKPKTPETLRALEGEPHRVLFEFTAKTAKELNVLPGNIVFLLHKDSDNWATVVFNGKKGIVPFNYLESIKLNVGRKSSQSGEAQAPDIPPPPTLTAPYKPEGPQEITGSITRTEQKPKREYIQVPKPFVLKIHCKFTIAVQIKPGVAYNTLLDVVCKKLAHPPEAVTLSCKAKETGELITFTEANIKTVWDQAANGRLTIWCKTAQGYGKPLENGINADSCATEKFISQMVALYSFEGSQPEDLSFQKGDIIVILTEVNEDWSEGQCNGNVGIFPTCFAQACHSQRKGN